MGQCFLITFRRAPPAQNSKTRSISSAYLLHFNVRFARNTLNSEICSRFNSNPPSRYLGFPLLALQINGLIQANPFKSSQADWRSSPDYTEIGGD